jgi:hypothetical protein
MGFVVSRSDLVLNVSLSGASTKMALMMGNSGAVICAPGLFRDTSALTREKDGMPSVSVSSPSMDGDDLKKRIKSLQNQIDAQLDELQQAGHSEQLSTAIGTALRQVIP